MTKHSYTTPHAQQGKHFCIERYPSYSKAWLDSSDSREDNLPVLRDKAWGLHFKMILESSEPKVARKIIDSFVMTGINKHTRETDSHRSAIVNRAGYDMLSRGLSKHPKKVRALIEAFSGYPYNWNIWGEDRFIS